MGVLILDDRDTAIEYGGVWLHGGLPVEYNSTTTYTSNAGSTAKIVFVGTGISVHGTLAAIRENNGGHPTSTYTLEANALRPATVIKPNLLQDVTQYQVKFYEAMDLTPNEQHTLIITNNSPDGTLFLDEIRLYGVVPPTSSELVKVEPKPKLGAIVGAALGGTAALCALLLIFLYLRWRRMLSPHPPMTQVPPPTVAGESASFIQPVFQVQYTAVPHLQYHPSLGSDPVLAYNANNPPPRYGHRKDEHR